MKESVDMLKTNVIPRLYQLTLRAYDGAETTLTVYAESAASARLKAQCPEGWAVTKVVEL